MEPLVKGKVEKITFDNGFRLLLEQRPSLNSVAVVVGVGAGSIHETEKNNGVAHFLEHTVFKGSKRFPNTKKISDEITGWGGMLNAFTDKEDTRFVFTVPSAALEKAFTVFTDVIREPLLREKDIEKERNVILSEIAMRSEDNYLRVYEAWTKNVYRGSSLCLDPGGTEASVRSITRADVRSFMRSMYTAPNSVMAVVGRFDKKFVVGHVKKKFGRLSESNAATKIRKIRSEPPGLHQQREAEQAHVLLGRKAVRDLHPDSSTLGVIAQYLSERLYQSIREKRGLGYTTFTRYEAFKNFGHFLIYCMIQPDKQKEALAVVHNELARIASRGVPLNEVKRAKKKLVGNTILSMEDNYRQAFYLVGDELKKSYDLVDQRVKELMKVSVADTKTVAKRYLSPEDFVTATVEPKFSVQG